MSLQEGLGVRWRIHEDAGFTDLARYGMVMKAIKTDHKMMEFVLICGDDTYETFKRYCLEYERNQKVQDLGSSSSDTKGEQSKNETTREQLCEQTKNMQLMMTKLEKKVTQPKLLCEPYCWKCKKTDHYASQCTGRQGYRLQFTYCSKHGHSEHSYYTKQADKIARKRKEGRGPSSMKKKDDIAESEGDKPAMCVKESQKEGDPVMTKLLAMGQPVTKKFRVEVDGTQC